MFFFVCLMCQTRFGVYLRVGSHYVDFGINFVIDFGAFGFHFGSMLAPFFIPGVSWKFPGVFWVCLRASWGRLKRLLGAAWARLGASRGRPGAFLEHLCRVL